MVELVVEQRVAADREAVWRAWTDPEAIARWWWRAMPQSFRTGVMRWCSSA